MKTVATEQSAIAEVVQRLALANHSVAFSLSADGRQLFSFPRANSVLERVRQIFGGKLAARCCNSRCARSALGVSGLADDESGVVRDAAHDLHLRQRARGARQAASARGDAGLSDADAARTPSGGGAVPRAAARRGRRQRASDEDRGALQKCAARFSRSSIMRCATGSRIRPMPRRSASASLPLHFANPRQGMAQVPEPRSRTRARRPLRLVADNPAASMRIEQRPLNLGFQRPAEIRTTALARCARHRCRCTRR